MKFDSEYDLLIGDKCFDIHRVPFEDIFAEMKLFIKVLKKTESGCSMDCYPYSYLYKHSFSVLEQILDEYFSEHCPKD